VLFIRELFLPLIMFNEQLTTMTTQFRGQKVTFTQTKPEVNQIWRQGKNLFKVYDVSADGKMIYLESESGERFGLGIGWFDGISYIYVGTVAK
jgi:hypothetical protein